MSNEEQTKIDKAIEDKVKSIFVDPIVQQRAVDVLTSKRPPGWNNGSYAPYFKAHYARWVQKAIDQMIALQEQGQLQSIVFSYSVYCDPKSADRVSEKTLYFKINQALSFLFEYLDPTGEYKKWKQTVKVNQDKQRGGVCIDWIREIVIGDGPIPPRLVESMENKPLWEKQMYDWIESDVSRPFIKDNLALKPEDVLRIKTSLAQLGDTIMASITSTSIKLIKINQ